MDAYVENNKNVEYVVLPDQAYHTMEMGLEELEEDTNQCSMLLVVIGNAAVLAVETAALYYGGHFHTIMGQAILLLTSLLLVAWLARNYVVDQVSIFVWRYQERGYVWAILLCIVSILIAVPAMVVVLYTACTAISL